MAHQVEVIAIVHNGMVKVRRLDGISEFLMSLPDPLHVFGREDDYVVHVGDVFLVEQFVVDSFKPEGWKMYEMKVTQY